MSLIAINLLPTRKKENLQKLIRFIFFKEILEVVLLVAAFLAMTMLWGWILLQEQFNYLSQSALLVNKEFSRYNQEVRKINFTIKALNASSQKFSPLTPRLKELIDTTPSDIKISSLNINREVGTFQISGTAQTRDSLLNFQNILKNYDWLDNLETPTSQLFQKDNINFEIKGKTKNIPLIAQDPIVSNSNTSE